MELRLLEQRATGGLSAGASRRGGTPRAERLPLPPRRWASTVRSLVTRGLLLGLTTGALLVLSLVSCSSSREESERSREASLEIFPARSKISWG
jgi:hypothetical protein